MQTVVNYWAVLVAAIASMVIGSIWYGPVFGKKFMQAMGMNNMSPEEQAKMKKGMWMSYVGQFIASLVMFYVLAWLIGITGNMTPMGGATMAFWAWLGFMVPQKFGDELWGGKMILFWLSAGSSFITLVIGGAIIGAW